MKFKHIIFAPLIITSGLVALPLISCNDSTPSTVSIKNLDSIVGAGDSDTSAQVYFDVEKSDPKANVTYSVLTVGSQTHDNTYLDFTLTYDVESGIGTLNWAVPLGSDPVISGDQFSLKLYASINSIIKAEANFTLAFRSELNLAGTKQNGIDKELSEDGEHICSNGSFKMYFDQSQLPYNQYLDCGEHAHSMNKITSDNNPGNADILKARNFKPTANTAYLTPTSDPLADGILKFT
jgi:hypothetical protein